MEFLTSLPGFRRDVREISRHMKHTPKMTAKIAILNSRLETSVSVSKQNDIIMNLVRNI